MIVQMRRSAIQEWHEAPLYPISIGRLALETVGTSMTTVLTKSFPQEKPPVTKVAIVLESGHLRSSGFVTWLVWAALHVLALPQLQNRFRVQTQWFWSYLSGQRSSRLISEGPRSSAS
jgi:hypothetical protein